MSGAKSEGIRTSAVSTEEFDAFFAELAKSSNNNPPHRTLGRMEIGVLNGRMHFSLDHIQGFGNSHGRRGSGTIIGRQLETVTGGGTYELILNVNEATLKLTVANRPEPVVWSGFGQVDAELVGAWTGQWN